MKISGDLILVIIGVILVEIGGVGMIRLSPKHQNPTEIRRLGWLVIILGIVTLIFSLIGILFGVWSY